MDYQRMPIEMESPESLGYDSIECNLAESSARDARFGEMAINLSDLTMGYGDHLGKTGLRALLVENEKNLHADQVLLTVGAAGALFIIHSALLAKRDHLIVVRPNYATNLETPRAIGCQISFIDLVFEDGFALEIEKIKTAIRPNTKIISITTPHNPTGTLISRELLESLIKLAEERRCLLLVDETYRDISFQTKNPLAASLSKNAISISSVSKAYGIPGIRLGWIITQDKSLLSLFLAAKEQIHICNSVVDEEICYQYLLKKDSYFPRIKRDLETNFLLLKNWITGHSFLEWVEPSGGAVCFPRFKNQDAVMLEKFYTYLLAKYKTYVGPGHWFAQSDRYFRIGFGWEKQALFAQGLINIDKAIADAGFLKGGSPSSP
jgi:aspartate/methionine/tyrosine aminotransferase